MSDTTLFWLILGIVLIVLEFFIPGLVVVFLGAGAIIVGLLQALGILDSWITSIAAWFGSSFLFMISLRGVLKKYLPGDVSKDCIDEDEEAYGMIVEVLDTVSDHTNDGRIKFRGTTWSARCIDGEIEPGRRAKIVLRDHMVWIVEQHFDDEDALLEVGDTGRKQVT